jgi:hypothetical protein
MESLKAQSDGGKLGAEKSTEFIESLFDFGERGQEERVCEPDHLPNGK